MAELQERSDGPRFQTGLEDADVPMEPNEAPDDPSVAPDNPRVNSPPLSDSGEHGLLSPPPQRLHEYNLRSSRQPLLKPLEGHTAGTDGPASGKRRPDTSCDCNPSKKPRAQLETDCLTISPNGQTHSQGMKQSTRNVSSSWFPQVFGLVISALAAWSLGMI